MVALASSLIRQKREVCEPGGSRPVSTQRRVCPRGTKSLSQKQLLILLSKVRLCGGRPSGPDRGPEPQLKGIATKLFCRQRFYLQANPDGSVRGTPEDSSSFTHFNLIPVGLCVISIQSTKLGHYVDMNVDSRTLDSRMRSCFWQRDLVPQGHTHRCADIGWLPPGSWTSRFCRIRLLASATMVPRKEIPPNRQMPGASWAPPEKRSLLTRACSCLSGPGLLTPPTGPEAEPPAAASSNLWAPLAPEEPAACSPFS